MVENKLLFCKLRGTSNYRQKVVQISCNIKEVNYNHCHQIGASCYIIYVWSCGENSCYRIRGCVIGGNNMLLNQRLCYQQWGASCNRTIDCVVDGGDGEQISGYTFTGRRVVHTAVTCIMLVTERESRQKGCARLREQNCTGSQAHSPPPGVVADRYLSPHVEMSLDTLQSPLVFARPGLVGVVAAAHRVLAAHVCGICSFGNYKERTHIDYSGLIYNNTQQLIFTISFWPRTINLLHKSTDQQI